MAVAGTLRDGVEALRGSIGIRLLAPGDEAMLDRVAPEVFDNPVDPTAAAEFLADDRTHLAVAVDGDVIVGFASGLHYFHPDKPTPELFINEVGVAPTHQRRGLATALVRALLTDARSQGCEEAWVLTDSDNAAARGLYSALGGRRWTPAPVGFSLTTSKPPAS